MTEPQFNLGIFSGQKLFWIKQIHNYHNGQPVLISANNYFMIDLLRQEKKAGVVPA